MQIFSKIKKDVEKMLKKHIPVLLKEVVSFCPNNAKLYVDCTLGHWWHAKVVCEKNSSINLVGIDKDETILRRWKENLKKLTNNKRYFVGSYSNIDVFLQGQKADYILLDLWVNLEHFTDASRGFSIKKNWPLDMRFDKNNKLTAKKIIDTYPERKLAKIFVDYGDFSENASYKIAKLIIHNRQNLKTTYDLKNCLLSGWIRLKKIVVIFQALRIEVNQEIKQLSIFLEKIDNVLSKNWRCAIISYHSIEDRIVKNYFKKLSKNWYKLLNKKVIKPKRTEIKTNPASRSARLRVIQRI